MACFEIAKRSDRTTLIFISRPQLRQTEGLEKLQIEQRVIPISWSGEDWYYTWLYHRNSLLSKQCLKINISVGGGGEQNELIHFANIGIENIEKCACVSTL